MRPSISRQIAAVAVFATLYAILNQIPISKLIGGTGTLTLAEIFSPLAGMVLGPLWGAASVFMGTYESVLLGRPLGFLGFDFIPPVAAALTAGLAIRQKTWSAVVLSLALFLAFSVDPYSMPFIDVGGYQVPYYWMQLVAVLVFAGVSLANKAGVSFATRDVLVVAIVFLSTMNAQVAGGLMYENVFVLGGLSSAKSVLNSWSFIFYVYPPERAFYAVAGSLLAVPVLRALPRSMVDSLRGTVKEEPRSPVPSPGSQ